MQRLHALDALRAFAMLLGISLHAAIAYQVHQPIPWPAGQTRSLVFDLHNLAVHAFRLQLFFLVAGLFARLLYCQRGAGGLARNRCRRVVLPLAAGMVTLVPLSGWLLWRAVTDSGPMATEVVRGNFLKVTGHLWFLYYLALYYVATLALAPVVPRVIPARAVQRMDQIFRGMFQRNWSPLALAAPTLVIFSFSDVWVDIGLPVSIVPIPRVLAYYGCFFLAGWFLHRNLSVLEPLQQYWKRHLAMAAGFLAAVVVCLPVSVQPDHPGFAPIKLGAMAAYNLFTWSAIFGITGLFLRYLSRPRPFVRYGADASYWFYLAHLPVVLFLQMQFRGSTWPAGVQFSLIMVITLAVLAASYHGLVRYTWIGTVLNGKRERGSSVPAPQPAALRTEDWR